MLHSDVLERLAEDMHAEARKTALRGPGPLQPHEVARELWGDPNAVTIVPRHRMQGDALLGEANGRPRIFLREGVSPCRGRYLVGHEIGHWGLRHMGWDTGGDDLEEARASYLGACILAPRSAYRAAVQEHNDNYLAIAERFKAPQSCVVLRYGEVTNRPIVLVKPKLIRKRGTPVDPDAWLPDSVLADWAWKGTDDPRVKRVHLTDCRGVAISRA